MYLPKTSFRFDGFIEIVESFILLMLTRNLPGVDGPSKEWEDRMSSDGAMEDLVALTKRVVELEFGRSSRPQAQFRDRYLHTLRVLRWAERIHEVEGGDLFVITLASLLHDVGWDENIPHQKVSFTFASDFLSHQAIEEEIAARVCNVVLLHNQRQIPPTELRIEERVVMDADALDESGILTLIWDSLAAAAEDGSNGYHAIYDRISTRRKQPNPKHLHFKTDTGLRLFEGRKKVLESALNELRYELES